MRKTLMKTVNVIAVFNNVFDLHAENIDENSDDVENGVVVVFLSNEPLYTDVYSFVWLSGELVFVK